METISHKILSKSDLLNNINMGFGSVFINRKRVLKPFFILGDYNERNFKISRIIKNNFSENTLFSVKITGRKLPYYKGDYRYYNGKNIIKKTLRIFAITN